MHLASRTIVLLMLTAANGACSAPGASRAESAPAATAGAPATVVRVHVYARKGAYLTDASGRSLYLFEQDPRGRSTCDDDCAVAWPPYVAQGTPTPGDASVRSSLLSTIRRRDGRLQVTYAGWPLYYDLEDARPGDTAGHDVDEYGAKWYLVTPSGRRENRQTQASVLAARADSRGEPHSRR